MRFPVQSAKFPVSNHRELAREALDLLANVKVKLPISASIAEISLYFPAKQGNRDGFADDCLHRQYFAIFQSLALERRETNVSIAPMIASACNRSRYPFDRLIVA